MGDKVNKLTEVFSLCNLISKKIKNKFNHLDVKEVNTPHYVDCKLFKNSNRTISQLEYASAVGSLLYGMHTRPYIAFQCLNCQHILVKVVMDIER